MAHLWGHVELLWYCLAGQAVAIIGLSLMQVRQHRRLCEQETKTAKFLELVNLLEWMQTVGELSRARVDPPPEFFDELTASGMRKTKCVGCGCELYTRDDDDRCPPCREEQKGSSRG